MRKYIILLICLFLSFNYNFSNVTSSKVIEHSKIHSIINLPKEVKKINIEAKYDTYLAKLSHHESRGNSRIVNKQGCIGLYQFKVSTLRYLGYEVTLDEFKNNPDCFPEWQQHEAAIKFTKINKQLLSSVIDKYNGQVVNGITITETGILAAAALAGHGGVKKYFNSNQNNKDINGTSVECMLRKFSNV